MELPDPDRWEQINTLLLEAQSRSPDERPEFLDEACAGDPELRREVETLLNAESEFGSLFDEGAARIAEPLLASASESAPEQASLEPGRKVGPYRLLERIGQGGTSTVYRAERSDEQFERIAAIKVLRRAVGIEAEAVDRFRAERQILASVSHPHLAEVYDGGVLPDGRPYLVMEYVEGCPITEHCREKRLSVHRRLSLFLQAASAVQAAHEQLVVHRDLKPSNVMVEAKTETVKLLDFGIAKILGELPGGSVPVTRTGRQPMTPAYAAPEQVKGDTISVATDTYALGVLLYELLTGERPYGGDERSPYAVARAVCEEEPIPPSDAVDDEHRRTALRGDLDAIVMKALRKASDERYSTVDALVDDLERYRTDRPVRAKKGHWSYRTRKFVRRHRESLLGVTVALVLLATFAVYHVQRLSAERDQARREAQKAEQVSDFLVELFGASDPSNAPGDTVTARELLRRGADRASKLDDQPEVKAQMLLAMGQAYEGLGRYQQAKPLLEEALSVRRQVLGEKHAEVANVIHSLGVLAYRRRSYERADSLFERSLAIRRRIHDGPHPDIAESLNDLAVVRRNRNDYASADTLYQQALSMRRDLHGAKSAEVVSTLNNLAVLKENRGQHEEAESLYREVLSSRRSMLGEKHPRVANTLHNLATNLRRQGELERAEELHRDALSMRRAVLGGKHPKVAETLNSLGNLLRDRGDWREAESLHKEALEIRREQFGADHVKVANSLNNLAMVLRERGQYKEAEHRQRQAVEIYRSELGNDHRYVAIALDNLADIQRAGQGCSAALSSYRRAQTILRAQGGEASELAEIEGRYGTCLVKIGDYRTAEPLLKRSYQALKTGDSSLADQVREDLVSTYEALGQPAEAERYRGRDS